MKKFLARMKFGVTKGVEAREKMQDDDAQLA